MAKEIWDKLKVTHEGTFQVKESKITLPSNQYEMFKMQPNESITSWFDQYTTIVNQLNQLGIAIPKDELVKRLLRSLPKGWRSTIVAIREAKDMNKILLDDLYVPMKTNMESEELESKLRSEWTEAEVKKV